MTTHSLQPETRESPQPVAAILAVLIPGLGHLWLREPRRAAMLAIGITLLTFGGLLIGGLDAIDRKQDKWWFVGQAGIGPAAFVLDNWHQRLKRNDPYLNADASWFDDNTPGRTKSLAHANEIGSLWIAIAGMLNLIAIIDAAWHTHPSSRTRRRVEDPA